MTNATLRMVPQEAVDPRTTEARYSHPAVCHWFPTTQAWVWKGGDALVVVTGHGRYAQPYVILRVEDKVHVVPAEGLTSAARAFGLDLALAPLPEEN
jgi:hypothetical protein